MDYDVAVIGGGPGGYAAAIKAAKLGAKVLLVEKEKIGGVCLHHGCIPTKTLLDSAEKWRQLHSLSEFGLTADNLAFDFTKVKERMNQVISQLERGILQMVKSSAVEIKYGTAVLEAPQVFKIQSSSADMEQYTAQNIILATGSEPIGLPVPGSNLAGVLNSDQVLSLTEVPRSMVIVGAGAVGLEFATAFKSFGCNVTVVEMMPQILPGADSDIVKRLGFLMRKQGFKILTNTKVIRLAQGDDALEIEVDNGKNAQVLTAEKVLVAIGRKPLTEGLGLERAGVKYSAKGIEVDAKLTTNVKGIYAIGDVTGKSMLAHAASTAGIAAAENALGGQAAVDFSAVPACVFTTPEVAMVGLTEQAAAASGRSIKISKANFAANGKAVSMGQIDGLVKIIADSGNDQILGMHILGPHASDLIMEGALAVTNGLRAKDIGRTIHPHPTISETIMGCIHGFESPKVY
ncbi:MAG: dihydrolipoyl dehydrogenase [Veillonellales bacterium]